MNPNAVQQLFERNRNPREFAAAYLDHLRSVLNRMDTGEIGRFIELLWDAREKGQAIYFLGNGGSSATASHFVNDLSVGTRSWAKPFRAICLTDNVPGFTAAANDYGYENAFEVHLKARLRDGDLVVAISASGNSPNLLKAIDYAKSAGAVTIGLTGFDGGKLRSLVHHCVHVPTTPGEYGPVEDTHLALDHLVSAFLSCRCAEESKA